MSAPARRVSVGVNLNNREALIAPDYDVDALLELGTTVEELGFDSVWVGDSLFARPRYEPLALLAALSQRTARVRLGTACLITTLREPVSLALAWATLDVLSHGRMVMGACAGAIEEERAKHEYASLGIDVRRRMSRFEESLHVVRELLRSGSVTFHGEHFHLEDVAFESGTEPAPLGPVQDPAPIWVVANPAIARAGASGRAVERAARRVVTRGDGWMTCCRAKHPHEVEEFLAVLADVAAAEGEDPARYEVAYQVTMALGPSREEAERREQEYIDAYYPEFGRKVDLADWGPAGTPDDIRAWMERFAQAGVTTFVCRFADLDQPGQVEWFAREVLPALRPGVAG